MKDHNVYRILPGMGIIICLLLAPGTNWGQAFLRRANNNVAFIRAPFVDRMTAAAAAQVAPAGEEFSVAFPQTPRITVGRRFFGDRQGRDKFRLYVVFTAETLFMVESYESDQPKDAGRILVSSRRGLSSLASIELDGFKGKEFTQDVAGLSFKGRYFSTHKHFYIVETAKRGSYDPAMDQFLNSFSLDSNDARIPVDLAPNPDAANEEVIDPRTASSKAIILCKLPASYTDAARAHSIRGTVVLSAVLRATGDVGDIKVQAGLPEGLSEQSIEATKGIIFVPALKEGKAVSQRIMVEYNFNIF